MRPLLTCEAFLAELSEFLDEETDAAIREKLERHIVECHNCWVICDTTKKTIQIYKGMKQYDVPEEVHSRLMAALQKKIAAKKC